VDCRDQNGCTPLHIAALYGHELLSGTLLAAKADPGKKGFEGEKIFIIIIIIIFR
jgi:ankyrin repeat protein